MLLLARCPTPRHRHPSPRHWNFAREGPQKGGVERGMAHRFVLAVVLAATGCAAAPPPVAEYVTVQMPPAAPVVVTYASPAPTFGYTEPRSVVVMQTPPVYVEPAPSTVVVAPAFGRVHAAPQFTSAPAFTGERAPRWAVAAPLPAHTQPRAVAVPAGRPNPIAVVPARPVPLPAHILAPVHPVREVPPVRVVVQVTPAPHVVVAPRAPTPTVVARRQPPHIDLVVPWPLRPVHPSPRG